jgi:hypothetical protein
VATPTLKFRISPCKDKRYLNTFDCVSSELMQYFPFANETAQWQPPPFFLENLNDKKELKNGQFKKRVFQKKIPFTKMHTKYEGNEAIIIYWFLQAIYLYRKAE